MILYRAGAALSHLLSMFLDQVHSLSTCKHIGHASFSHPDSISLDQRCNLINAYSATAILIELIEHGVNVGLGLHLSCCLVIMRVRFGLVSGLEPSLVWFTLQEGVVT